MTQALDWPQYGTLKAEGLSDRAIARQWGIPWATFHRERQRRQGPPSTVHPATADRPPSTVDPAPSTVEQLQAALTAALQPVLVRLDALEAGLARQPYGDRPPSTLTPGS